MKPSDLPPVDHGLARLYEAEKQLPDLPPGLKQRMYARIAATLGVPGGPGGSDGPDGPDGGPSGDPGGGAAAGQGAAAGSTAAAAASKGAAAGSTVAAGQGVAATVAAGAAKGGALAAAGKGTLLAVALKPATVIAFLVGASSASVTTYVAVKPAAPPPAVEQPVARPAARSTGRPPTANRATEAPATAEEPAPIPPPPAPSVTPHREPRRPTHRPRRTAQLPSTGQAAAAPTSQPANGLAAERQLLTMARVALGRGDYASARAALQRHGQQHPNGQLAEERDALVVLTLLRMGRVKRAREVAARFRARYPSSLLLPTVEAALSQADR